MKEKWGRVNTRAHFYSATSPYKDEKIQKQNLKSNCSFKIPFLLFILPQFLYLLIYLKE